MPSKLNNPHQKLVIAYAGLLADYESCQADNPSGLAAWFRRWRNLNIRHETRSGKYLIEAARILNEKVENLESKLSVKLWGKIGQGNQRLVDEYGLGEVCEIEGKLSQTESRRRLEQADLLFLPLECEKDGQRPLNIPGKLYDYLELGKPILGLMGESDCKDIIENSGLGIICPPDNPEAIAETLEKIIYNKLSLPETTLLEETKYKYSSRAISAKLAELL